MTNVIILNKNQKHFKKHFESGGFKVMEDKPVKIEKPVTTNLIDKKVEEFKKEFGTFEEYKRNVNADTIPTDAVRY